MASDEGWKKEICSFTFCCFTKPWSHQSVCRLQMFVAVEEKKKSLYANSVLSLSAIVTSAHFTNSISFSLPRSRTHNNQRELDQLWCPFLSLLCVSFTIFFTRTWNVFETFPQNFRIFFFLDFAISEKDQLKTRFFCFFLVSTFYLFFSFFFSEKD